ncbi:MAG: tetratricopeptide repeat protein [Bacteroidota bacterium]
MKFSFIFCLIWGICLSALSAQSGDRALVQHAVDSVQRLLQSSQYDQVIAYGEPAIRSGIEVIGEGDSLIALLYSKVAFALLVKHQIGKAMSYLETAMDIWRDIAGPYHVEVGRNLHTLAKAYYLIGKYQAGIRHCQQALTVFNHSLGEGHLETAAPYNTLGGLYLNSGADDQALPYFQKAMEIRLEKLGPNHQQVGMSYNNLGAIYEMRDDFERATHYLNKGLEIKLKTLGEKHLSVANSYGTLARLMRRTGDLTIARTYQQKSLDIGIAVYKTDQHPAIASDYYALGNIENFLANHEKALFLLKKALEIQQTNLPPDHPEIALSYVGLGSALRYLNRMEEALEAYHQALRIWRNSGDAYQANISAVLSNIGDWHKVQDEFQTALEYYQEALPLVLSHFGPLHSQTAEVYVSIANMYSRLGEDQKALELFDKGLNLLEKTLKKNQARIVYGYDRLGYYYYSRKQYDLAEETYEKAIGSLGTIQQNYPSQETKQAYFSDLIFVYEDAIQNILAASKAESATFDKRKAFTYSEQAKSRILREALNSSKAQSFAGIPDSLLQKEYDLRIDIAYHETKQFEEEQKEESRNDSLLTFYRNTLFNLLQEHTDLIHLFEESYPSYYRLIYDSGVKSVAEVQSTLQEDEALIEYFMGKFKNYVLVILKDSFICQQLEPEFPLTERVEQMRQGMFGYHLSSSIQTTDYAAYNDTFATTSLELYQHLIAPFQEWLPEKLIIIPSGVLGYLPFEALLTEPASQTKRFKSHAYLLQKHQISYCYSATLLEEMKSQGKGHFAKQLLAIAPAFTLENLSFSSLSEQRADLGPLLHNVPEVKGIQKLLGGTVITGTAATKDQFMDLCSEAQILHLATHGKANDAAGEYSYLAFTESEDSLIDQKMYVSELYNLRIPADLVVLSACETGIGELQSSEGIISLARGFSYAGAKSILTSLWRVGDGSTAELMRRFYTHLRQGMSKDAALRQAKLDFIDSHPHDEAHPYFWAGFVPIGDMSPIEFRSTNWWLISLTGLLFIFLAVCAWRIRQARTQSV